MYRLQFKCGGSVLGQWLSFSEAWDECLRYGAGECEIQTYIPEYGVWIAVKSQPKE